MEQDFQAARAVIAERPVVRADYLLAYAGAAGFKFVPRTNGTVHAIEFQMAAEPVASLGSLVARSAACSYAASWGQRPTSAFLMGAKRRNNGSMTACPEANHAPLLAFRPHRVGDGRICFRTVRSSGLATGLRAAQARAARSIR
jgi:hypothetical protein